jgi:arsenite-transporting ATPase
VEIDAARALRRWLADRRPVLERIAVQGTWLEADDVAKLLQLSLPGIDELAALLEISRFADASRFDTVVVDTAPTGHTLRMLQMPVMLAGLAGVFDVMREKQRVMEAALRGLARHGAEDDLIAELAEFAQRMSRLVRDPARSRVSWVTLAEPMALAETLDAIDALETSGLQVSEIVVNRVTPEPGVRCGHCHARRTLESATIRRLPPRLPVLRVRARKTEPRGVGALRAIARDMATQAPESRRPAAARRWQASLTGTGIPPAAPIAGTVRLVMLGGKGGVGKTTCAAAMALSLAAAHRSRRVLLVSTDPAHSLADVFGYPLSDTPGSLPHGPANLLVREMDASAFLAGIRDRYINAVDRMFDRLGGPAFDAAYDRSVMRGLIDLAPPGLDELAAVLETTEALMSNGRWDLVVMDTAPTGHALRLLQMPALIQSWARALMEILLKYQNVTRLGELGESLLNLSKGVGRLRRLLSEPERSAFVVVTRPAALPRLETARLMASLETMGVRVPAIVINAVGRGDCHACRANAAVERREIDAIVKAWGRERQVITTGNEIPPPHGIDRLRRWTSGSWRTTTGYHQPR